jgi:hypothetical protein
VRLAKKGRVDNALDREPAFVFGEIQGGSGWEFVLQDRERSLTLIISEAELIFDEAVFGGFR